MSNQEEELERQFQADLEKAIALSLEASEFERIQSEQRRKSLNNGIGWRVDGTSGRPRPGFVKPTASIPPLSAPPKNPPIYSQVHKPSPSLPPPPSTRKHSTPSSTSEVSDLISFHSPTKPDDPGLNTAKNAVYPDLDHLFLNDVQPSASTSLPSTSTPFSSPLAIDCAKTEPKKPMSLYNMFPNPNLLDIGFRREVFPRHAPFPKPTLALADRPEWSAGDVLRTMGKRENNNLIDLSPNRPSADGGSVLDAFDPLAPVRAPPPDPVPVQEPEPTYAESTADGSIYDTFDPFDYMYSPTSLDGSQGEPVYAAVQDQLPEPDQEVEKKAQTSEWIRSGLVFDASRVVRPQLGAASKGSKVAIEKVEAWQSNAQLKAFCEMVSELRAEFEASDRCTNAGLVLAPTVDCDHQDGNSVKLVVAAPESSQTVTFTCDLNTTVEHVISHVVCELEAELPGASASDFVLKVAGLSEYFAGASSLGDYEYVYQCMKLDRDVALCLVHGAKLPRPLARTLRDDANDVPVLPQQLLAKEPVQPISYETLTILLDTMEREIERLTTAARQLTTPGANVAPLFTHKGVEQAVKAVCSVMGQLETVDISTALEALKSSFRLSSKPGVMVMEDQGVFSTVSVTPRNLEQTVETHCESIREAVHALVHSYCWSFNVDFRLGAIEDPHSAESRSIMGVADPVLVLVGALHRLDPKWRFPRFLVEVQIYHGTRVLRAPHRSSPCSPSRSFYDRVPFNTWISVDDVPLCALPREARLVFALFGLEPLPAEHELSKLHPGVQQYEKIEIGWAALQCFDHEGFLTQGRFLLSVWPVAADKRMGPAPEPGAHPVPGHPVLELALPAYAPRPRFTPHDATANASDVDNTPVADLASLDPNTQQLLLDVSLQGTFSSAPPEDREILWEKRHYLVSVPQALPKVLLAATAWDAASLPALHGLVRRWTRMPPLAALQLLLPCFPDGVVRTLAVSWLRELSSDELVDYLPQLVQALKHETYDANALARFLLEQALTSPRVAHHLFWLLVQILPGDSPQNSTESFDSDPDSVTSYRYHWRLRILLRALLTISGEALRQRFCSQQFLVKTLFDAAQRVKQSKESLRIRNLHADLEALHHTLQDAPSGLPLSASVSVVGVQVRTCSYFPSKTLPLKINFVSDEARLFPAIFKVGDDLQQDALTLQMIRVMDKLWLKEGLDLKMVTFACVPTGRMRGMIQLVEDADTLRMIQTEHGLTGSFKDRPIAEWLAKHNPGALEYERAVRNFTASCAGYSVATYVLGICDRHNDNIMLKTSGHLFHIDFGKFLGDAQMFGNFKRDRAPFVLTSDMAYVINGGDRPSQSFQQFVDLCCQAFAVVRQNSNVILNLLGFMVGAGIPGVTLDSMRYVQQALLPGMSKAEAAASFSRLIDSALRSWFTQFNFFLHNLSQLRASSDRDAGDLLSFVPKRYTCEEEGRIVAAEVHNLQKRYGTEKHYVYVIRLEREGQPSPSYVFRTYREFCELHQKICALFPLAKVYSLPAGMQIGRSAIKRVAETRKQDIEKFLVSLFKMADEVAHSDIVYTFFHPLLRDQEDISVDSKKLKEGKRGAATANHMLSGQLKLTLQFQRGTFTVMVEHARGLAKVAGGQEPNTYVKVYLLPDPDKSTKRKTKVVRRNCHPTFMEMLEYRMALDVVRSRILQATIWSYDSLQENEFLGGIQYSLAEFSPNVEVSEWFPLGMVTR